MFDFSSKILDFGKKNIIINRNISLDEGLECFLLISSSDLTLADNVLNKILDLIIDKIGKEDSYSDFSLALQNINSFLKQWNKDLEKELKINIIIGLLDENTFLFSEIGKVSCYLIKNNNELLEVTDKKYNKKQFGFISSGELSEGEIIVMGTHKLLNYLSNSDFLDGARLDTLEAFNENIVDILNSEIIEKNLGITSIKYKSNGVLNNKSSKFLFIKEFFIKLLDNNFSKKIIASYFVLKDKISKKSKTIKNIIFILGIIISFFLLYSIILNIVGNNSYMEKKVEYTKDLEKAKSYVVVASENINNPDLFNLNINNAEKIIETIKKEKLFLNDLNKMKDDISILKKQFNGVEIFEENSNNKVFVGEIPGAVKILKKDKKLYVIGKNGVYLLDQENLKMQPYIFEKLDIDEEYFIDATVLVSDIILLTNKSKIVKFNKGYFNFVDVKGQKVWQNSKNIESYGRNIYLLGQENNQIYKHSKSGARFNSALNYLKDEDVKNIGNIRSIAIDGGIYILKNDLSMLKFFASPKYRIEKLILNKLPKNYNVEVDNNIEIKTRANLNYVYMLLNNKIFIFKPNRKVYNDVKSLMYLGQIEGKSYKIIDFYPSHDGEIIVLNESGLYKLNFDVDEDDKIILR
ncbi:hypothetical protein CSA08_04040 [Candidatus Gracilibacteria bacterium]|nr:MAG: hypothetical protein CSA08_04040 [Candidatus Gracilibacteria bacterium]